MEGKKQKKVGGKERTRGAQALHFTMGFDSYTTPSQQPHNNPSHEGEPQCVEFTLM
jgi:hypothetical protein